jgi:hypothetical protein
MSQTFDMELFLAAVLNGSHATRQRHLRQAKLIQAEIAKRWKRETPGLGRESMWLGFSNITCASAVRRRAITTF